MGWKEKNEPENTWYRRANGTWYKSTYWSGNHHGPYGYFRYPKLYQEVRRWDDRYDRVSRRCLRRVLADWDGTQRHLERSWKRHRDHQYKVIDWSEKHQGGCGHEMDFPDCQGVDLLVDASEPI